MSNEQVQRDPTRTKMFYMHSGERSYQAVRSRQKNMLVCKIPSIDLNAARSRPKDTTKMFVSLIVDVVDPPQTRSRYLVMSLALEQVFSEIEKGAEEWLKVIRSKKECVEAGEVSAEMVPKRGFSVILLLTLVTAKMGGIPGVVPRRVWRRWTRSGYPIVRVLLVV